MLEEKITFDKFIRWSLTAVVVVIVLLLMNYLSSVLLPFFVAWLLAYMIYPIVKFVQYKMHVPTRVLSIIISIVFIVAVIGGIFYLIVPPMIEQFDKLSEVISRYLHQKTHINNFPVAIQQWLNEYKDEIQKFMQQEDVVQAIKGAMPKVFSVIGQTANVILSIVASLITLLYLFSYSLIMKGSLPDSSRFSQKEQAVLACAYKRRRTRDEQLHPWTRPRGIMHRNTFLYRLYHHRIPNGNRTRHTDRHTQPHSLRPRSGIHPYGNTFVTQGRRYGPELLGDFRIGNRSIRHRTNNNRHGAYPQNNGQGNGPQSCSNLIVALCMGCLARFHRTHHRHTTNDTHHSILPALYNKRKY